MFIQLKLPPLWEPTHFIPEYSCLASWLDLDIGLEGETDASSSQRVMLQQPVPRFHAVKTVPADFPPCKYGSKGRISWSGLLISKKSCFTKRHVSRLKQPPVIFGNPYHVGSFAAASTGSYNSHDVIEHYDILATYVEKNTLNMSWMYCYQNIFKLVLINCHEGSFRQLLLHCW